MIHITEDQVREILSPAKAVELLETCFRRLDAGQAVNHPRRRVRPPVPSWACRPSSASSTPQPAACRLVRFPRVLVSLPVPPPRGPLRLRRAEGSVADRATTRSRGGRRRGRRTASEDQSRQGSGPSVYQYEVIQPCCLLSVSLSAHSERIRRTRLPRDSLRPGDPRILPFTFRSPLD